MKDIAIFKTIFNHFKRILNLVPDTSIMLINSVILTIVYVLFVGLTAITAKITRKSFFVSRNEQVKTYWINKEQTIVTLEEYRKQF